MKRRDFITLAGVGAIGAPAQSSPWRPDGVGSLARIGVLTPHFDPVPESEMWAMAPSGVSVHAARVHLIRGGGRGFDEPPQVDDAAEQVSGLTPRVILYAWTTSSYVLGAEGDDPLRARLEKRTGGIPVVLTCPAAVAALRSLGGERLALIHPPWFSEETNAKGAEYFRSRGFEVAFCARITPARDFTEVPPEEVYEWTRTNVPRQAEAVFIGGNGLRAVGAIHALEETLGRSVLTANQVLLWEALRGIGLSSKVKEYGRVFG
jgi:maleate isomerase